MRKHIAFYILLIGILSSNASTLLAQREVSVTQTFEPSFSIEPLVHRLEGRRGDVLQFQFRVASKNKDADIEVGLVGLRQQLSGQILHDESRVDTDVIQLLNPGRYTVARDEPHIIEGIVKVPSGQANYYSYGVLVKDFGSRRTAEPKFDENGKELTSAGINFITQYVLRLDIVVAGSRGQSADVLVLEDGQLSVADGLPNLTTLVRNPSDSAFEFELRARLKRSPSDRTFKPVRLVMPVRQSMETEERYVGRILPKSTIRMQEVVPEPLMTGSYEMEIEMLVGGREAQTKSFVVDADVDNYPAQQAHIANVGGDVYVSPARVELSQLRGGDRRINLQFQNNSDEARTIMLQPLNDRGTPIAGLMLQPSEFTLSPGRSRRLSVSLQRVSDFDSPIEYGNMTIVAREPYQEHGFTGGVPIAIHYGEASPPEITMEPARWVSNGKTPAFRALVKNMGSRHAPIEARLQLVSDAGQRFMAPAGYGQWLMPGKEIDLEFPIPGGLPPGNYSMTTELHTGGTPIIQRQDFSVSDFDTAEAVSQTE